MKPGDFLKNISITNGSNILGTKTNAKKSPVSVFKEALEKQIKLVKYDMNPKGEKPEGARWYVIKGDVAETFLRYSVKKVFLKPDMNEENCAYEAGRNLEDLLKFYNNTIDYLNSGAIDSLINKVAADMIAERNATREKNEKDPVFLANKEKRAAKRAEKKAKEEAEAFA